MGRKSTEGVTSFPYIALAFSGLASLILQVIWTRFGVLIFGTTTLSITTVLSVFMGGLALGNAVVGKWGLNRVRRPFLAYAGVEMSTGLLAAGIVLCSVWFHGADQIPGVLFVSLMMLATTMMGMTLPFMIQGLREFGVSRFVSVAWAYGINTVGGAVGALLGAFVWLPKFGLFGASWVAVLLLFLASGFGWVLRNRGTVQEVKRENPQKNEKLQWGLLGIAAWGGASSLSLEIVWTRLLSLILGPSVYAFGVVLFVYLLGISLGSVLSGFVLKRLKVKPVLISSVLFLLALSVALSSGIFGVLPFVYVSTVEWLHPSPRSLVLVEMFLSFLALMPTALLHGFLLPLLIQVYGENDSIEKSTAWSLSINTLGAIIGSMLTGLWLIPSYGFMWIVFSVIFFHVLLGLGIFLKTQPHFSGTSKAVLSVVVILFVVVFGFRMDQFWDRAVLSSGVYKYAVGDALKGKEGSSIEVGKVLFYREGKVSTVAVLETPNDRVLSIDGKADASAYGDRSTQVLLGALPMSLSRSMEDVLVIGFASGVTAGVASLFPESHVTSVEIEPAVYEAAKFFEEVNHGPLLPPNHDMRVDDARRFLRVTPKTFDVITSEPSNPWMSGVAPLFTQEFFRLASEHLAPQGVMCQWLPIYGMSTELVSSVMKTFHSVFPHVLVFESIEGFDLLMIGSFDAVSLDPRKMESRWGNLELQRELTSIGITKGVDLIGRFILGAQGLERFSSSGVINTDDNGYLEFRAPLDLHLKTAGLNDRLLSQATEGIGPYLNIEEFSKFDQHRLIERFKDRKEQRLIRLWEESDGF